MTVGDRLAALYYALPWRWRVFIHPRLQRVGQALRRALVPWRERRLPQWWMQGRGLWVCFAGREAAAPYLQRVLLGRIEAPPASRGFCDVRRLASQTARGMEGAHILVAALERGRAGRALPLALQVPALVEQWSPIPADEAAFAAWERGGRERAKEINKIRALSLSVAVTRDPAVVREFYEECHRPTILARHGAAAYVDPWNEFQRYLLNGAELLQVMSEGHMLSGVLLRQEGELMHGMFNGVRGGDPELLKGGMLAAEYYFLMRDGMRRGCTWQNFGRSRPFLRDGVLQFKRKFGGLVRPCPQETTDLCLQVTHWSPAMVERLAANALLAWQPANAAGDVREDPPVRCPHTGRVLTCCLFLAGGDPTQSDRDLAGQLRRGFYPGSSGMALWALDARWQERLADPRGLCERVSFPLTILRAPLGPHGLPVEQAWPALIEQWRQPQWLAPLEPIPDAPAQRAAV